MLSKTPNMGDPVWTSLAAAMGEEPRFRSRVRDAALRILSAKLRYLRGDKAVPRIPDPQQVEEKLPDPEGAAFFLDLAARSVTLVNSAGTGGIPLRPEEAGRVLLAGQFTDFFSAGRNAYPGARSYWYSEELASADFLRYAREADTIIFCISDAAGLNLLKSLRPLGKRVILFSVLSPAYLEDASWVDGAIAVYSYAPESFVAGFSALLGRIPAGGKLPL
jgi:beta-N-acetylhexosaminidase